MHILVMSRFTLSHGFGGFGEDSASEDCVWLCKGRHKVTVLTTSRKDGGGGRGKIGHTVKFLSPSTPMKLSRSWFNRALSEGKIHRDDPIDVIHSNEFAAKGVMGWAKKNGIPMAVVCHGSLRT